MAKTKRQSARPQSQDIDQAFQLLLPCVTDRDPHRTAGKLNRAIVDGDIGLWKQEQAAANKPPVRVPREEFSEFYIVAAVERPDGWHGEVRIRGGVFFGGDDPAKYTWIMSTKEINDVCKYETAHPGGAPRTYDHDDVRAAAFFALVPHLRRGIIPETYSGNDLAHDVRVILGDGGPGDTTLKGILNPLLTRIKNRQAGR